MYCVCSFLTFFSCCVLDNNGWTALHHGAKYGKHQTIEQYGDGGAMAELMINGADVFEKDNNGWTPLHAASRWGNAGAMKILIQYGADVSSAQCGWTPLHYAASAKEHTIESMQLLLENGADPCMPDSDGKTALHSAAQAEGDNDTQILDMLMEYGADSLKQDNNGKTAMDWAKDKNFTTIADKLQEFMVHLH